jgi:hypothetical protein
MVLQEWARNFVVASSDRKISLDMESCERISVAIQHPLPEFVQLAAYTIRRTAEPAYAC